jgi:hypothetical protein
MTDATMTSASAKSSAWGFERAKPRIAPGMSHFHFQMVGQDNIEMHNRVRDVNEFVCAELNLSPAPKIIWIRPIAEDLALKLLHEWRLIPENEGKRRPVWGMWLENEIEGGFTPQDFQNEIWIRHDLSQSPYLEYASAHEIRHVWQKAKGIAIFDNVCSAEGDAYPYGCAVLKRFLASKGELTPEMEVEIDQQNDKARATFQKSWPDGLYEVITEFS